MTGGKYWNMPEAYLPAHVLYDFVYHGDATALMPDAVDASLGYVSHFSR